MAEQRARASYESGVRLYQTGAYPAAAQAFRSAYEANRLPALLYNIAQAERLAGDCAASLSDYRAFEAAHVEPVPSDMTQKKEEMESCVRAAEAKSKRAVAVKQDAERNVSVPDRTRNSTRLALICGGAAGAVVSGGFGLLFALRAEGSVRRLAEVNRGGARWGPEYSSEEQSLSRSRDAALGFFVASGLFSAATVWLLVGSSRGKAEGRVHSVWSLDLGPGRALATISVRF